ncbi:hypothetical protein C923_01473 [Plasmodium falciparum UGT5.1]|uniref:Transmembrane protein n=1 Tax=Plasmodium falciparum UGT5.1 TaxID=1237627 RepID=W7JG41_PLAFA|nr:hypothetical protein C923_01473 [Plasmodium falciparum UGT5.1]
MACKKRQIKKIKKLQKGPGVICSKICIAQKFILYIKMLFFYILNKLTYMYIQYMFYTKEDNQKNYNNNKIKNKIQGYKICKNIYK